MAYISTEAVRAIRNELKKTFPNMKFSVRKDRHISVEVNIMKGNVDFSDILEDNDRGYAQINHYYTNQYGDHEKMFNVIIDIMRNAPVTIGERAWYDNSDSMTDYFDTAYYIHLSIGKWNKPYEMTV